MNQTAFADKANKLIAGLLVEDLKVTVSSCCDCDLCKCYLVGGSEPIGPLLMDSFCSLLEMQKYSLPSFPDPKLQRDNVILNARRARLSQS